MGKSVHIDLSVSLEELPRCSETVKAFLTTAGVGEQSIYHADLVLEELLSNIVRHSGAKSVIAVDCSLEGDDVVIEITDDGRAFDPTTAVIPRISVSASDAKEGGLGIHMVRSSADGMRYQREGEHNHVAVRLRADA